MQAYEWVPAATELATAVRLDPNNVEARVQYARLLRVTNRNAEALTQLQAARSADPASALREPPAWTYFVLGQMDARASRSVTPSRRIRSTCPREFRRAGVPQ
jgi:predicted Zn-dependent protease